MGETSGSVIRALSLGRPLVVSDLGWFSELPNDVALKVPVDEDEIPALATALELLTPSGWFFNLDHFGSPEGWEKHYRAIRRQFTGKPPQEIAPHRHEGQVNAFFVLEGEVEFALDGGYTCAGRGSFMAAPPGALHGLRNPGSEPARVLFVRAPAKSD